MGFKIGELFSQLSLESEGDVTTKKWSERYKIAGFKEGSKGGHWLKKLEMARSVQQGTQPCQCLDFSSLRQCQTSNIQNSNITNLC